MKTEFLQGLGLSEEQIQSIMAENGKDVMREQEKAKKQNEAMQEQITKLNDQIKDFDTQLQSSQALDAKSKEEIAKMQTDYEAKLKQIKSDYDAENGRIKREAETQTFFSGLGKKFVNEVTRNHYEQELNKALTDKAYEGKNRKEIFEALIKGEDGKERLDIFVAESNPNPFNLPPVGDAPTVKPKYNIPKII